MSANYTKVLIKLHEGSFLDLFCHQQYIMSGKVSVVDSSSAVQSLISRGKATLFGSLKDSATQEAFDKALKEAKGDEKKAVAAFLKVHDKNRVEEPQNNNPAGKSNNQPN